MKQIPSLLEYFLNDCLHSEKCFTIKKMFGGYGIYRDEKIFAIYAFEEIYFKSGEKNRNDFIEKNSKQFSYEKQGKIQKMRYYTLPEEIMEDFDELKRWIDRSCSS